MVKSHIYPIETSEEDDEQLEEFATQLVLESSILNEID